MLDFGASRESIELIKKQYKSTDDFEVFADNWDTVIFFSRLSTQWRIAVGMGGGHYLGLDYSGVEAVMRLENIQKKKTLFADLQIMEREALTVLNKKEN